MLYQWLIMVIVINIYLIIKKALDIVYILSLYLMIDTNEL
jgi:hypothetical protein